VGAGEIEGEDEPFKQKMARLVSKLEDQFTEAAKLEEVIRKNLRGLDYGG
jgi:type I restriction enzyme M protein